MQPIIRIRSLYVEQQIMPELRLRRKRVFGVGKKGIGMRTTSVDKRRQEISAGSQVAPVEVDEEELDDDDDDDDDEDFLESRTKIHTKRGRSAAAKSDRKYGNSNAKRKKRHTTSVLDLLDKESAGPSIFEPPRDTKNASAFTPDLIPIPGVRQVSGYGDEQTAHFSRPEAAYITQVDDELSLALMRTSANYDMDSEDEDWLTKFNTGQGEENDGSGTSLSDDTFELMVDAFEKAVFCSPHDCQLPFQLCSHLYQREVVAAVHSYWEKKMNRRKKQKSALVRVFEAHKKKNTGCPRKNWKQLTGHRTRGEQQKTSGSQDDDAIEAPDIMGTVEAADTSANLAVKMRSRAQFIMTNADLMMYRAKMAIQIAESAKIRESLGISPTELVDKTLL